MNTVLKNPEPDDVWLAQHREEILDPEIAIVDAHHHLWPGPPVYGGGELLADIAQGHRVVQTVFIEANALFSKDDDGEEKWLREIIYAAEMAEIASERQSTTEVAAAIVGRADMRMGSALDPLLARMAKAGRGRFRGIRQTSARDSQVHLHAPEGLLSDINFRNGFVRLFEAGLTFDAWLYHPQLDELSRLLESVPYARVALNHMGGRIGIGSYAGRKNEVEKDWRDGLRRIAAFPNVVVKLGGLGMTLAGHRFREHAGPPESTYLADIFSPYINYCIECFGDDRCIFESNFPVDKGSYSYEVLWNAFKRISRNYSGETRAKLFAGNAKTFYSLN